MVCSFFNVQARNKWILVLKELSYVKCNACLLLHFKHLLTAVLQHLGKVYFNEYTID